MGARLVGTIMPFLGLDDRGIQVVPTFVAGVNWSTLAITCAAMAFVFAIIMIGRVLVHLRSLGPAYPAPR